MTIKATDEVRCDHVSSPIGLALSMLAGAPLDGTFWITAVENGQHMDGSEHDPETDPQDESDALDGDALSTSANLRVGAYLDQYLPPTFDVIVEDRGGENEHIHIEHDP